MRTTRHKNITRIDQDVKRTHGFYVRVTWKGVTKSKFFSDAKCGDRLSALDAAIEWRNATEREMGKPRTERIVMGMSSRNTSGIIGVRRRKRGNTFVYEATWIIGPGRFGRTSYSVARHGERRARKLAKEARQLHERKRWATPRRRIIRQRDIPQQPVSAGVTVARAA